jgi:hypothetical protein
LLLDIGFELGFEFLEVHFGGLFLLLFLGLELLLEGGEELLELCVFLLEFGMFLS